MASRKCQTTTASMLDHRARASPPLPQGREAENEGDNLPVEDYVEKETEVVAAREGTPTLAEHECLDHSGDGDSSSDYVNNTSEEEDYDEGLPEEEEGITYYIRYCPEDDGYLEGMDCSGEEYVPHEEHPVETDECQEAVEEAEWSDMKMQHRDECEVTEAPGHHEGCVQVLEGEVACLEIQDQEENLPYCHPSEERYQGYYSPEANGNPHGMSPYHSGKEEAELEEQEEDIDQIVAEIKMSMSMSSINSASEMSPEHGGTENVPNDYAETCPKGESGHSSNRHLGRPKSLNIPTASKQVGDVPRGFKTKSRTPEERQTWPQEQTKKVSSFPSFVDVPGPCEPEDLIDGIIFAANYLGSTQLLSERNPSKNIRMMQAQEAVSRVKRMQKAAKIKKKASSEGDSQALTEVDLFISTQRIKVLNADTQETMMDHALRTISYIADIGNIVVLMARRRMPRSASQDCIETTPGAQEGKKQYKMICHVFESEDAQLIAQSIGQAFSVAYQEFLRANGINPEDLSQKEYSDIINTQEMYNDDLIHFSNSENCKELQIAKHKGEILGVVIVESGWGSILPTVILANMMNGAPAARSGKLSIGDQIMSINGTSLVGLPLATCQGIIKGLKNQTQVKLNIVSCPPVTTVLIKRPDLKYQLGFSVQNGIIHMKTMPAAMFRLLTGQETPLYI
ncbi:amyloid-beta A4 precursor protein-binding family A member 2 isoform X3 [Podarcis raffonei]|uniref:amyloid-beta A4 precursor protein-binding family A member 2 isoform X3 n=1 Tax=Podarcis raffonei TaxID=65483 RepID=UPI00232903D4|nr:amyloid-beta A4 precursor protein-binding family A member 2 isoform X3 [Podarcis raffonei]